MYPASCKRQKHENGHDSSPSTQSQSSIIGHNRCVRLQFLEQFNDLKYGSATRDYKAVNIKRHELMSTLEKLQEVPIQLPYASSVLKSSDARLHSAGQNGGNFGSANFIDLDADNVGDHGNANVDNIGADTTVFLVDSDDEDRIKSFGDENSSGSKQIQECLLPEQPGQHQEIIMLDNENSSSEAQPVVKHGKDSMAIDNEVWQLIMKISVSQCI